MEAYRIDELNNTVFTLSDVVSLMHAAFEERTRQGLTMGGSSITEEELAQILTNAVIFVAYSDKELLGVLTARYTERQRRSGVERYCHLGYVAVAPTAKRGGIGGQLLSRLEEHAKKEDCAYIISNTAESADSSVAWHLKHGFRKLKYTKWKSRNYNSIIFRKEIKTSIRKTFPFISDLLFLYSKLTFRS
jgi:GNAT superfamily N-acetyltransferase